MKIIVGLDLGSTAIKAVFTDGERVMWRGVKATAPGQEKAAWSLINDGASSLGLGAEEISGIAATGYGKKLFTKADRYVDEISANAAGVFSLSGGEARTVINIGGQDVKILFLGEDGRVSDFKMNDKCAAGTGRFFELVSRLLDVDISEFDRLSGLTKNAGETYQEVELNSTCVVFAESEIVSLMARGVKKEAIAKALFASVSRRAAALIGGNELSGAVYLDGGPALNKGLALALGEELMTDVKVLDAPQFSVAYGAARILDAS
jgi:predicted CoA-substrate-specific enzyme activase